MILTQKKDTHYSILFILSFQAAVNPEQTVLQFASNVIPFALRTSFGHSECNRGLKWYTLSEWIHSKGIQV